MFSSSSLAIFILSAFSCVARLLRTLHDLADETALHAIRLDPEANRKNGNSTEMVIAKRRR